MKTVKKGVDLDQLVKNFNRSNYPLEGIIGVFLIEMKNTPLTPLKGGVVLRRMIEVFFANTISKEAVVCRNNTIIGRANYPLKGL